jgi:iron(III) transport system substrate-binding protein
VASEGFDRFVGEASRRFNRRTVTVAGVALLGFSAISPLRGAAQEASPEPEADPVADPEPESSPVLDAGDFTLYSGRNEALVSPLIGEYAEETGTAIDVRYGSTGELAATLLEEGEYTPAAAFLAQDAGALGLLANEGRFIVLPEELLERVEPRFRDPEGRWVGVSGRARVLAYNTDAVDAATLPASVTGLTDPAWAGRIGWAPENASFQAFITAFRLLQGDDAVRAWLEAMIANGTVNFGDSNSAIVQAIGSGEIDAGLVNHYYVYVVGREEGKDFPVANHFFAPGDPGSLINVAGYGILDGAETEATEAATAFLDYLLSDAAQNYFASETFEYPLAAGVAAPEELRPLGELESPEIDLGNLADLRGTLDLLAEVGLL